MNANNDKRYCDALENAETAEQMGKRQLWDRQVGESTRAYFAFVKYRDLAERRTMKKVAEMLQCSEQNIARWAQRWSWTHRAAEFDRVEEEKWREQTSRDRVQMRRRQIALGQQLQAVAAHGLQEWRLRIAAGQALSLSANEIATLMEVGSKLEQNGVGDEKDRQYTKIVVSLGTYEYPDEQDDGNTIDGGNHAGAEPKLIKEYENEQYQMLDANEKAALEKWRDPPKKMN